MRRLMRFEPDALLGPFAGRGGPSLAPATLARLGIPLDRPVTPAWRELLDQGARRLIELAEPRAVVQDVSAARFRVILRGDPLHDEPKPLDLVLQRAKKLALFVATLGPTVSEEITRCFERGDPALGTVLDAAASEAANKLALLLATGFAEGLSTLPYSPGYCGWRVSGQRNLFDEVSPEEIGVTLTRTFVMSPVKSVSGVLVAGPADAHRFHPDYYFCDDCETRECLARMRSLLPARAYHGER